MFGFFSFLWKIDCLSNGINLAWLNIWITVLSWKCKLRLRKFMLSTKWFTKTGYVFLLGPFSTPKNLTPILGPRFWLTVSCFTLWNDLIFRLHINQKWTAAKPRRFQSTWGCAKTAEKCNLCLLSKLVLYQGWTIEVVKRKQLFFIFQNF